mmetsp:Transcript_10083/g.12423  ORF Transcript_10083/g.12423 Transcript_10083/m.12423 type:complete len:396 (-) Transcript_10083:51-1238(-)
MVGTVHDHSFKQMKFTNIKWCVVCKCFIWSVQKGLVCTECKLPCHKQCTSQVPKECNKKPKVWRQKTAATVKKKGYSLSLEKKLLSQSKLLFGSNSNTNGSKFSDLYTNKRTVFMNSNVSIHQAETKSTGELVAIKTVQFSGKLDSVAIQQLQRLKDIRHPNLISIREVFAVDNTFVLTSEIAKGNSFFRPLRARDYVTEADVSKIIKNILQALEHLHANKIIHGMLRPEFIFVDPEDLSVEVSEFGLWKIVGPRIMCDAACAKMYVAPEMLQNLGFGTPIDMWNVGVIAFYLLSGNPPFYGTSTEMIVESVVKADFDYPSETGWDMVSDDAIDFIDSLLTAKPSSRLTASQALAHPFIQGGQMCTILNDVPAQLDQMMEFYQHNLQEFLGKAKP